MWDKPLPNPGLAASSPPQSRPGKDPQVEIQTPDHDGFPSHGYDR